MSLKDHPTCEFLNVTAETVNIDDDDNYDDDYLCSVEDSNVSSSSDDDDDGDKESVAASEEESEEDDYSNAAYSSDNNDEEEAVLDNHDGDYTAFYVDCRDCGAFHHVDYKACGVSTSHLCNIGYCIDGLPCDQEKCSNGNPFEHKCHISKTTERPNKQIIEHKQCNIGYCIDGLSCDQEQCTNGNPFKYKCHIDKTTATSSNKQIIEHNNNKPIYRIIISNHLLERCEERDIPSNLVKEIIRNNKGVFNHSNGTTEYYQHGICCITRRNVLYNNNTVRLVEEVGITAFISECKECGDDNVCSKGYCHDCCWGCNECNASLGRKCKECGVRVRGVDHCKNDRGVFCESCCYGCEECEGPRCYSGRERSFHHCNNNRGVFCKSCCYGCDDCWHLPSY